MGYHIKGVVWVAAMVCCGGLAGCSKSALPLGSGNVPQFEPGASSLEKLSEALFKQVSDDVMEGGRVSSPDFLVTPVPVGQWKVGTVLQRNRTVPVTDTACGPLQGDGAVSRVSKPGLFAPYSINRQTSVERGLDEAFFGGVLSSESGINFTSAVEFSVEDASVELWSEEGVERALARASCRSALAPGTTYWMVRGIVSGRREFAFALSQVGSQVVTTGSVGSLQVSVDARKSRVKAADSAGVGLLAVVTQFTVPVTATSGEGEGPFLLVKPDVVAAAAAGVTVYLQRDSGDRSDDATVLARKLVERRYGVASGVAVLASDQMPAVAEVRYFDTADWADAYGVWDVIKALYPAVRLVTVRIPAPRGVIEVWLPRVG